MEKKRRRVRLQFGDPVQEMRALYTPSQGEIREKNTGLPIIVIAFFAIMALVVLVVIVGLVMGSG